MSRKSAEWLSHLSGENVIAFGTGRSGKIVIPYLAEMEHFNLCGVTNSRIAERDAGTFLNTELPVRSIHEWAKQLPNATILMITVAPGGLKEIQKLCYAAGFHKVVAMPPELLDEASEAMNREINELSVQHANDMADRIALTGNPMLRLLCLANEIRDTHKATFSEFRACHRGKDVVIVATGPSMKYYSQIPDVPHIGVNASFL